jgi:hypothetical protein
MPGTKAGHDEDSESPERKFHARGTTGQINPPLSVTRRR